MPAKENLIDLVLLDEASVSVDKSESLRAIN